jgi:ribose transport system substrate-binding protein
MSLGVGFASAATPAQQAEGQKYFKVGYSTITMNGDYFVSLAKALKDYCCEAGLIKSPDDLLVLNADGDTAAEIKNIDSFIVQSYDLLFVDSTNPDDVVAMIDNAAEAGITVICVDSYVNGGNKVTVVYSDNLQNGRKVGIEFVKEVGDLDIYSIMLSGVKGNTAGEERRVGIMCGILESRLGIAETDAWKLAYQMNDELIKNGYTENKEAKFVIAGQGWGNWSIQDILKDANDLIVKTFGKLNTIFAENDQMLFGGMQAAADAGLDKGIYYAAAADGQKETYDLIKEGKVVAVGENSPVKIGELAAKIAHEVLVEGKDRKGYPETVTTDAVAVTKGNVSERYEFGF